MYSASVVGGSWVVISGAKSMVPIMITPIIRGLIPLLTTTLDPKP